jgi:hypothetical protein
MDGTCGTYEGKDVYRGFWQVYLRERECLEDHDINGKIILKWIFRKLDWG